MKYIYYIIDQLTNRPQLPPHTMTTAPVVMLCSNDDAKTSTATCTLASVAATGINCTLGDLKTFVQLFFQLFSYIKN